MAPVDSRDLTTTDPSLARRLAVALIALTFAAAMRLALQPSLGTQLPFATLYGAIALCVWYGGAWLATLVAIAGFALHTYFFFPPNVFSWPKDLQALAGAFIAYGTSSAIIVAFGHALRRSREEARTFSRREAQRHAQLEHEVAERRQTETALYDSAAQLRAMFNQAAIAIALLDRRRRFLSWNARWLELVGYSDDELARTTCDELTHEDDRADSATRLDRLVAGHGHNVVMDKRYVRRDGTPVWVNVAISVLPPTPGGELRFVAMVQDMTERRRAEEELREAGQRKDQFLAMLAHELRNPLAPIRNALQILKLAEADPQRVAATREMMERQVTQMVRLLDDLLDVSRITRNRLELQCGDTTVSQVLDLAVETQRPLIESAGHRLVVDLPSDPIPLHADRVRLAQVFGNLLSNATKYMAAGGVIHVDAERQGDEAWVRVRDQGIGIAEEDLPRIFTMFTQLANGRTSRQGGLGIGLAIVRSLVELHGGSIAAESEGPGRGSVFTVRLPLGRAPVERGAAARPLVPAKSSATNRWRILVVDDNVDAAQSLSFLLEGLGHEVELAFDGMEAVRRAESFRPGMVFMDLSMPHMTGLEAARRIRALPDGRAVVICALTGFGQEQDRQRSAEAGIDVHLVKPLDPTMLEAVLAR